MKSKKADNEKNRYIEVPVDEMHGASSHIYTGIKPTKIISLHHVAFDIPAKLLRNSKPFVVDPTLLADGRKYRKKIKLVRIGEKMQKVARKAREKKLRNPWTEFQAFVEEMHRKYSNLSYNALTKAAANKFKVSQKTIKRHTKRPI